MATHFSPVSSPVPLEILAMPIGTFVGTHFSNSRSRSRFLKCLRDRRKDQYPIWYFLTKDASAITQLPGAGRGALAALNNALAVFGARLGMFGRLNVFFESVAREHDAKAYVIEVVMGTRPQLNSTVDLRVLASHGLTRAMPIERLFVYAPPRQ